MKITTILFDAGGVILDEEEFEKLHCVLITEIISKYNKDYTEKHYWLDIDEAVESFCPDVYKFILWKYLKETPEDFELVYKNYRERWNNEKAPLKIMNNFKTELAHISKKYKTAIAGQYGAEMLDLLKIESVFDYFSFHFTQDDFSITKPDPRYFEQIATAAGVNPAECVMVGDRIDKDVIPAKMVGMKTVLVRTGIHRNQQARTKDEIPDIELDDINGLADAVDNITERQ